MKVVGTISLALRLLRDINTFVGHVFCGSFLRVECMSD